MKNFSIRAILVQVLLIGALAPVVPATTGWAVTVETIEDWYDPTVPLFASDLIFDPDRKCLYVADQITAQIFKFNIGDSAATPLRATGFLPSRDNVLSFVTNKTEWEKLLAGDVKLEWDGQIGRLVMFDGRKSFGADRWFDIDPGTSPSTGGVKLKSKAPAESAPRVRDQAILADAVAELAGMGRRVRPWRWSFRNDVFQLIDQNGRAYLFSLQPEVFGQKRLRLVAELDSLYSRLADLMRADLQVENRSTLRLSVGHSRWVAQISEDPYTGERILALQSDSSPSAFLRPVGSKKLSRPNLPQNWPDFLQQPKVLVEGPAGQLIYCKIRLTGSGMKSWLILSQGGRVRLFPWNGEEPPPEDVVTLPEGFAIPDPPGWMLMGWTPEMTGLLAMGNSRFQKIAPILSEGPAAENGETSIVTAGVFVLDAEELTVSEWPILEWPRMSAPHELQMSAEPLDLAVAKNGDAFVQARDAERGLRIFRLTAVPEPILDLPEHILPGFLAADVPTLSSKTETKQTLWMLAGQPPALIRKDKIDIEWMAGQGIAWRDEPHGAVLFSTDPSGESDTGITMTLESSRVKQAVQQKPDVWVLETDSGILRLDASDPTVPDLTMIDEEGGNLRYSPGGAVYTVSSPGAALVYQIGPDGQKKSLGQFKESWTAIGFDQTRLFFKDRATSKMYTVYLGPAAQQEENSQMTGRLNFDYDDPSSVLLCAIGNEAYCMLVRPKAPSFLLGPLPYGGYRMDVSAGLYDLAGPAIFSVTQPEITLPDIRLTKTLDFIYRRAVQFDETKNTELAKFNYELYLSLYPEGREKHKARSALLNLYAVNERWDDMIDFYRKSPAETVWTPAAMRLLLDHLPRLADRLDIARKWLAVSEPNARSAELLFFLYKHSLDPAYKSAAAAPGIPAVYKRFFESFDRIRP